MDDLFFREAIGVAGKGAGFVAPNPLVGAILVRKGQVVAEGFHERYGGAHAEVNAINSFGINKSFKDVELYVTLEPCCHHGKTPPCTQAILDAGIKTVYVGMKDPSEKVNGKGIRFLRKNGINVEVLNSRTSIAKEIRMLNQPFIKSNKLGLPYVVMKSAISLDGKISYGDGKAKKITSSAAILDGKNERSLCDSVMVGRGTILSDNPQLNPHPKYKNKSFLKIIAGAELEKGRWKFKKKFDHVFVSGDPKKILKELYSKSVRSVFIEGGAETHTRFLPYVDKVVLYIAPYFIGSTGKAMLNGRKSEGLLRSLKDIEITKIGSDTKLTGYFNQY